MGVGRELCSVRGGLVSALVHVGKTPRLVAMTKNVLGHLATPGPLDEWPGQLLEVPTGPSPTLGESKTAGQ